MYVKKNRRKMTVEELYDTDHYRSIIILTDIFGKNNGLRQLHYRWALIKNHDNMKHALFVRAMQDFFEKDNNLFKKLGYSNKLDQLYKEKILINECITSNSNLSNFLKRLYHPPYNILNRFEEDGVPRYKLTKYGKEQAKRWLILRLVKSFDASLLEDVEKAIWKVISKKVKNSVKVNLLENNVIH